VVGDTVYFPFVALVLFVAARVEFFDAWTWPLALALMIGACFTLLVLAFALLRMTAYRAREAAVQRLERKYLELIGEGDQKKELAAQVQHALELVRECSEGAFRPLSEEPLMRALIIPTGGLSGLGALQYFFVQRF
jgi:type VI protein secretion system component VasK